MKPVLPSTRGLLFMVLDRTGDDKVTHTTETRFGSIREIINSALRVWDTKDHPVASVSITFTTTGDRSRHGREAE